MSRSRFLVCSALGALVVAGVPLHAQQTTSTEHYRYDAQGRLIIVSVVDGNNSGDIHSICYDDAGNRTEYTAVEDGTTIAACVDDGSDAAPSVPTGTPGPPPPPPIQITDSTFTVVPNEAGNYDCQMGQYNNVDFKFCRLISNLEVVYSIWANPIFDTGYSMPNPDELVVEAAYHGTHD